MAICTVPREGMIEIESFVQAITERASSVLSLGVKEQTFCIGQLPFTLIASPLTQDWLGRAFLNGREPLERALKNSHRLTVWDGTSQEAMPPKPPWDATDYTPFGVVRPYSNQDVRFAFEVETSSL